MAHRAVLACCSPYLFEIFNSDIESHGVSHVTFEDLDPEAVEILLNYAYTAQSVATLTFDPYAHLFMILNLWLITTMHFLCDRLKADKELVKEVYSAAKRFKMERVKQVCFFLIGPHSSQFSPPSSLKVISSVNPSVFRSLQICGDYLLSKLDSQNAISFRNFASSMGDARFLSQVDAFIQDHLLEVSEQEDFLKLPRLKVLA